MQIIFKIHKHFFISTNSQPNSKVSGYFREGSVHLIVGKGAIGKTKHQRWPGGLAPKKFLYATPFTLAMNVNNAFKCLYYCELPTDVLVMECIGLVCLYQSQARYKGRSWLRDPSEDHCS